METLSGRWRIFLLMIHSVNLMRFLSLFFPCVNLSGFFFQVFLYVWCVTWLKRKIQIGRRKKNYLVSHMNFKKKPKKSIMKKQSWTVDYPGKSFIHTSSQVINVTIWIKLSWWINRKKFSRLSGLPYCFHLWLPVEKNKSCAKKLFVFQVLLNV